MAGTRTKKKPPEDLPEQPPSALEDLLDAPYNPRAIRDRARSGLRRSLVEFGDLSGITYNFRTGTLIAGHQRKKELADLDPSAIEWGPWRETDIGRERWGDVTVKGGAAFRVRGVDWSAAKEKAANVAANSQAIAGHFTDDLQGLLAELEDDPDLFEGLNLGDLKLDLVPVEEGKTDIDGEWSGMPDFDQENYCHRRIVVNFRTEEDVAAFAELMGQKVSDKTRFLWYPAAPFEIASDKSFDPADAPPAEEADPE